MKIEVQYIPPSSTGTIADVLPPYIITEDGHMVGDASTGQEAIDLARAMYPEDPIDININPHLAI